VLSNREADRMRAKMGPQPLARDNDREDRERNIAALLIVAGSKKRKRKRKRGGRITRFALTIEAAGKMAGMSKSAAYRAAKAGLIPVLGEGRNRIVPRLIWEAKLGINPASNTPKEIAPVA
jgi:hypothetical protein